MTGQNLTNLVKKVYKRRIFMTIFGTTMRQPLPQLNSLIKCQLSEILDLIAALNKASEQHFWPVLVMITNGRLARVNNKYNLQMSISPLTFILYISNLHPGGEYDDQEIAFNNKKSFHDSLTFSMRVVGESKHF